MDGWNPAWAPSTEPSGVPPISGELSTAGLAAADKPTERNSTRVPVEFGAGLRQRGGSGVSVHIMDLSTHGFRIETHLDLHEGQQIWLRLPGLESSSATVRWVRGYVAGCAFDQPLHPAVLELVVARARER
jgi:hypothetical protein